MYSSVLEQFTQGSPTVAYNFWIDFNSSYKKIRFNSKACSFYEIGFYFVCEAPMFRNYFFLFLCFFRFLTFFEDTSQNEYWFKFYSFMYWSLTDFQLLSDHLRLCLSLCVRLCMCLCVGLCVGLRLCACLHFCAILIA